MIESNLCGLLEIYNDIFFFDTETTGLNHNNDNIIELAIIKTSFYQSKPQIIDELDLYISQNGNMLPQKITEITGITDGELKERGIRRSDAAKKAIDFLGTKKKLLVAHNANFDMNFLSSLFMKENIFFDWTNTDVIDTLTVYKDRHKYPHKLSDAVNAYDLQESVQNYHRAIDDARSTQLIFDAMCGEKDDTDKYINLFGYNPKYKLDKNDVSKNIIYVPQEYDSTEKLYNLLQN